MTKKENVLVTLIEQIHSMPMTIVFSPIQDGDTVIGTASDVAIKGMELSNRLKGALAIAKTRLQFETDAKNRENLVEEAISIQIKLTALNAIVDAQLRSDVKNWNRPLVVREGGKVVVTPEGERFGAEATRLTHETIQQLIEAQNYGDPPMARARSRVMQFDLSQLGDLLGEGGIEALLGEGGLEAIFGAGSPYANGDGRGARTSAL